MHTLGDCTDLYVIGGVIGQFFLNCTGALVSVTRIYCKNPLFDAFERI